MNKQTHVASSIGNIMSHFGYEEENETGYEEPKAW